MSDIERDLAALARYRAARFVVLRMPDASDTELVLDILDRSTGNVNYVAPNESETEVQMLANLNAVDIATWPANHPLGPAPPPELALPPVANSSPVPVRPLYSSSATMSATASAPSAPITTAAWSAAPPPAPSLDLTYVPQPMAFPDNGGVFKASPNTEVYKWAVPKDIDLSIALPGFEFTIGEMMTYFSIHYPWNGFLARCDAAGWSTADIARYIMRSRGLWDFGQSNSDGLRSTITKFRARSNHNAGQSATFSATTDKWQYLDKPILTKSDCKLVLLDRGVTRRPTGADRGALTVAVEHASQNGHGNVMLSEVSLYIRQCDLVVRSTPLTLTDDQIALANFKP